MNEAMAFRLGRPDLMPYYGAPTNGMIADDNVFGGSGMDSGGQFTIGRIGLSILIIYVGAMATAYVATRGRQF